MYQSFAKVAFSMTCLAVAPSAYAAAEGDPAQSVAASVAVAPSTAPAASAEPTSAASVPQEPGAGAAAPTLQHAPAAIANMGDDFVIHAALTHPELVRAAVLEYRIDSQPKKQAMFQRSSADDYVAVVPEDELKGEILEYWIILHLVNGAAISSFASPQNPHRVQIVPTATDLNERALLDRVGGRRNVFAVMGEYVDFGHSEATGLGANGTTETQNIRDWYYRAEASYTYRPLRLVSEFSLRVGIVRGESPVPFSATTASGNQSSRRDVGLNYAAPSVRLRFADIVYGEGTLLSSVTEVGYSVGGGGALLLGDPYGTKLTLGFESVQVFGSRFYARTDIAVHPRLRVAPIVEVTDMPHADHFGVRLLGELAASVAPGVRVGVRGGYQARKFDSGSASFGALFAYEM